MRSSHHAAGLELHLILSSCVCVNVPSVAETLHTPQNRYLQIRRCSGIARWRSMRWSASWRRSWQRLERPVRFSDLPYMLSENARAVRCTSFSSTTPHGCMDGLLVPGSTHRDGDAGNRHIYVRLRDIDAASLATRMQRTLSLRSPDAAAAGRERPVSQAGPRSALTALLNDDSSRCGRYNHKRACI